MTEQQTEWKPKQEGSFWTYQFVRNGSEVALSEVYYSEGEPRFYNDDLTIYYDERDEDASSITTTLERMKLALTKPILDVNIFKEQS
jgi:hypothetical protein